MNSNITNTTKSQFFFVVSLASVVASIFLYTTSTDKSLGIFVGLWAPTLMDYQTDMVLPQYVRLPAVITHKELRYN